MPTTRDVGASLHLRSERGSMLIETMVAAGIVLAGLLALGLLFEQAMAVSVSTKAREQGVSLQREVVETARSIPYDELFPTSAVPTVQGKAASGLADSGDGAGWTVRRRGVTYTVSLGVCSVDDPSDGIGVHDATTFCASGPGTTNQAACANVLEVAARTTVTSTIASAAAAAGVTLGDCGLDLDLDGRVDGLLEAEVGVCLLGSCPAPSTTDATPDDYKRVVTLVRWDRGSGTRLALQSTIVPNPGLSTAPKVTALDSTTTSVNNGTPLTSGTSLAFGATTSESAAAVSWSVDGSPEGSASGSGTAWSFTWQLGTVGSSAPNDGEVLDGPYVIAARAFDGQGSPGQQRARTVRLNRRAPYAPAQFLAGRNGAAMEFQWAPSRERDVERYRVYRYPLVGARSLACDTEETTCRQENPPSSSLVTYRVVALDRDASGALREGAVSAASDVPLTNHAPAAPTGLQISTQDDTVTLSWTASSGDPDLGDAVDHYRIYRDGQLVADRYDRTQLGTDLTYTDSRTNGLAHTYSVAAVDKHLAESPKLGPVSG